MHVSRILKAKQRRMVTTRPTATVTEVTKLLERERIGAVLITDERGQMLGILSERDLVHGLSRFGSALLTKTAAELMTREVVTCTPETSLQELMSQMTEGRFRHLPVIEEGKLVGVVSIGDVVKFRLEELESEAGALKAYITSA